MPEKPLRVLHCISSIRRSHGGTSVFAAELSNALAGAGVDVTVAAPAFEDDLKLDQRVGRIGLEPAKGVQSWFAPMSTAVGASIRKWSEGGRGVVHVHGLWGPELRVAAVAALNLRVPLVYSPHGMLEPWSLSQKPTKKRVALALYQRGILNRAKRLHSTAEMEAQNLRKFGFRQPIDVVPVGVPLPEWRDKPASARRQALFISRIHPKKGVIELLHAWKAIQPPDWNLVLAGPNEGGHLEDVLTVREQLGLGTNVEYVGEVFGPAKEKLFRESDLFVLPTYSENFGIVVPEALSYGVPVVTTRGAPWKILEERGCGWWIDVGQDPLEACLRKVLALSTDSIRAAGLKGRALAEEQFQWSAVSAKMMASYRSALGM